MPNRIFFIFTSLPCVFILGKVPRFHPAPERAESLLAAPVELQVHGPSMSSPFLAAARGHGLPGCGEGKDRGLRHQSGTGMARMAERAGCSLPPGYFLFQTLLTVGTFSKFSAEFPLSNVITELCMAIKISFGRVM